MGIQGQFLYRPAFLASGLTEYNLFDSGLVSADAELTLDRVHRLLMSNAHGLVFTGSGSGGGLDADKLDGYHASELTAATGSGSGDVQSNGTVAFTGMLSGTTAYFSGALSASDLYGTIHGAISSAGDSTRLNGVLAAGYLLSGGTAVSATDSSRLGGVLPAGYLLSGGTAVSATDSSRLGGVLPAGYLLSGGTAVSATDSSRLGGVLPAGYLLSGGTAVSASDSTRVTGLTTTTLTASCTCAQDSNLLNGFHASQLTGGSGTTTRRLVFSASQFFTRAATGWAAYTAVSGTNFDYSELDYDKDVPEIANISPFKLGSYNNGSITFTVGWKANATSGAVQWTLLLAGITVGELFDQTLTQYDFSSNTTAATAECMNIATLTTNVSATLASGDTVVMAIKRAVGQYPVTAPASASNEADSAAANAFDGNDTTYWAPDTTPSPTVPNITASLGSAQSVASFKVWSKADGADGVRCKNMTLQYSDDNSAFTQEGTYQHSNANGKETFTLSTPLSHKYWRIIVTSEWATGGAYVHIHELSFHGGADSLGVDAKLLYTQVEWTEA